MNSDPNIIVIKYQGWMNWCHYIGLGAFIFNFIHIATGDAILASPYGLMLMVAAFEVAITSIARSRFRFLTIKALLDKGVDLSNKRIAFL